MFCICGFKCNYHSDEKQYSERFTMVFATALSSESVVCSAIKYTAPSINIAVSTVVWYTTHLY